MARVLADILDITIIVCCAVIGLTGIYYIVFPEKAAKQVKFGAKQNSSNSNDNKNRTRLMGVLMVIAAIVLYWVNT